VQGSDALRRLAGLFREAVDQPVEARIVAGEASVAQPERRRQRRRLGIAQPLVGAIYS
jgi:hypothetical protein